MYGIPSICNIPIQIRIFQRYYTMLLLSYYTLRLYISNKTFNIVLSCRRLIRIYIYMYIYNIIRVLYTRRTYDFGVAVFLSFH